jgi:hypothetical protein
MYDQFISFYDNLPIARALYSFVLVILIFLLIGQLGTVWRSKISISDFSYFTDGKKNAEYADQFRSETIANYSMIVGLINADRFKVEQEGADNGTSCEPTNSRWYRTISNFFRKSDTENPCQDSNKSGLDAKAVGELINSIHAEKADDIAKTLDFSVEGVNLKGLLSAFSNLVTPPETTIVARLYENGGKKRAYVSLEGNSNQAREVFSAPLVSLLETPGSDSENAYRIACYLIWIQLNKARAGKSEVDATRPVMSFEEFYDWARIINAKNVLETADLYRLDTRKKGLDVEFIKQQIVRATRREIGFRESYAALSGLEKYFGSEQIKLNDRVETTIDATADLVRYFAITRKTAGDDTSRDWLDKMSPPVVTREAVNQAYFKPFISTDCAPDESIAEDILKGLPNVVRITRTYKDRRSDEMRQSLTTGLVIDDGLVLTVFSGTQDKERLSSYFAGATVKPIQCGKTGDALPVTFAAFAAAFNKSPFVLLTVPNLKRPVDNPTRDFSGFDNDSGVVVAGYPRDATSMFAVRHVPAQGESLTDKIYFLTGTSIANYQSDFAEDTERRVYLDVPYATGMIGSPIYSDDGQLIGFVEIGLNVGKNLSITIGVPIGTLKNHPSLVNKPRVAKK